jgi:DUF1680 family protein
VYTYIFDKKGKCNQEKIESSCPSCFSSNLQTILDIKKYHWKKINENQYVSDFESKLMIELPTEKNVFAISVLRMDWTRVLYDILMEK